MKWSLARCHPERETVGKNWGSNHNNAKETSVEMDFPYVEKREGKYHLNCHDMEGNGENQNSQ